MDTSLHNQQLSGYKCIFKKHKCFLCPEVLELACAKGGWKALAFSWKKLVIQGVRLVRDSETCTHCLAVSSSATTVSGMCPEQARLPGLMFGLCILVGEIKRWISHFSISLLNILTSGPISSTNSIYTSVFATYFFYFSTPSED